MTGIRGTTMLENLRANLDSAIERANKLDKECDLMSKSIAHLSRKVTEGERALAVRRDISKQRLDVLTKQTRTIFAQDKKIDVLDQSNVTLREVVETLQHTIGDREERNDAVREAHARVVVQRNTARNQLAADGAEIRDNRARISKLLDEVKGAHSNADMWLDQVHQRDKHITDGNAKIKELKAQIKQGDEELRLLMCDIHPDGRTRGHISMMDKIEHVAGEANRFTQSKIAGLQHKNQEIGSKLGYYKMKTGDLRGAVKVSESVIKMLRNELATLQLERDVIAELGNKWKRKYHGLLKYHSPRFTPRAVHHQEGCHGKTTPYRRIDLADPTIGNTDD